MTGMAEPGAWATFYVMAGGAAAALSGLIFVAVSLQTARIMGNRIHRDRAWSSVALLMSQLFISLALLVPAQSVLAIGLEIDVLAVYWLIRTIRSLQETGAAMRSQGHPGTPWQLEWLAWVGWVVALIAAGGALTAQNGAAGFPLLAIAMVGMFGFAIWSSWILISESTSRIPDRSDQPSRAMAAAAPIGSATWHPVSGRPCRGGTQRCEG
jgi:modulator of FtsH protease